MSTTRERALEAAVDLLGTGGVRALTHRRVDERAGLPDGSTSNHFRTRAALLLGVTAWMGRQELAQVGEQVAPSSADELVERLAALLEESSDAGRVWTTARLTLFMEASHDRAVREEIAAARAAMESWFTTVIARLGAPRPELAVATVAACYEGLLLHRIARHDTSDPRPVLHGAVAAVCPDPGTGVHDATRRR